MEQNKFKNRALTYSLLAHINNNPTIVNSTLDIFIPLIKRVLSLMNSEKINSGKSILEIKERADKLYQLKFPITIIDKILHKIAKEINTKEKTYLSVYEDKAFMIDSLVFVDFDKTIKSKEETISIIELMFEKFCKSLEIEELENKSIFKFIENSKYSLSRYLTNSSFENGNDYSIEAQFVEFFKKIPVIYEEVKQIYLGSILASYIEYEVVDIKQDIQLIFDTNFIISLLDLNTPESTLTCKTLLEITHKQGYEHSILIDTILEIRELLKRKAEKFDTEFLLGMIYPEDIYNACQRQKLNKTDLERFSDNLDNFLESNKIEVIRNLDILKEKAKKSKSYEYFMEKRNNEISALHDALTITYVKDKRGYGIEDFVMVNCWLVNNSRSREKPLNNDKSFKYQPYTIKADDLVNILWLTNPQTKKNIPANTLSGIGLESLLSLSLNDNLPSSKAISELNTNIQKYAKENISSSDILKVGTRIANKQLKDIKINELNQIAQEDSGSFTRILQEEADKQTKVNENKMKLLDDIVNKFQKKSKSLDEKLKKIEDNKNKSGEKINKLEIKLETQEKKMQTIRENSSQNLKSKDKELEGRDKEIDSLKEKLRDKFYEDKIKEWRKKNWKNLFIVLFIITLIISSVIFFKGISFIERYLSLGKIMAIIGITTSITGTFIVIFILKPLSDKYNSFSNIENFKKGLKLPDNLK